MITDNAWEYISVWGQKHSTFLNLKRKYSELPKVIQNALINLMEDVGGAIGTKLMGST